MWSKGCVSPARGNTAKADYCLILILLLNECSDKYQGKVKMCVKASVRWYPQSSGLFLPIYAPLDSYYFTATDNCHWLTGQTTYHLPNISIWTNGAKCFFFLLNSGKLDCMFCFVFSSAHCISVLNVKNLRHSNLSSICPTPEIILFHSFWFY